MTTFFHRTLSPHACRVLLVAMALWLSCECRSWAAEKPLPRPMGAWFALYQKLTIDDEVVWPSGAFIETHYYVFDLSKASRYSAILIGPGSARTLNTGDTATLEQWVRDGGTLIVDAGVVQKLWGTALPNWVAGMGATSWWRRQPASVPVNLPGHPLLKGIDAQEWSTNNGVANVTSGTSLIGDRNVSMLHENRHGEGRVLVVPPAFIPQVYPKARLGDMTLAMKTFWANLVAYLRIPTRSEVIAAWARTEPRAEPLTVWQRFEEEKPLGGKLYNPPHPLAKDVLPALNYDMGIGEINRRSFFVTTAGVAPLLRIAPGDLVSASGQTIPASRIRIYVQEKPLPDWPKSSYWLVEPQYVEPLGSPSVQLKADETYTYWVILDSADAAPGDYKGNLRFWNGETLLKSLPLNVKVWPLHQPDADVLHFELEHIWFSLPGGYWIGKNKDESNPALLKRYQDNLGRLGVDVGQSWGDLEKGYYDKYVVLREDGRMLSEAIKENSQRFRQSPLPSLSFSGPYDEMWNNAIDAGMAHFARAWSYGTSNLAKQIYGDPDLKEDSPENARISQWYWSEFRKYLRERGLRETYIKIMDEFGPERIPEYIRSAGPARAAGFKTYTTTYNLLKDKAAIAKMDPYTDMWQVAWPLDNLHDFFGRNAVPFDKNNEIWGTTASSFWGQYIDYPRGYGWEAARLRMDGLHVHGYLRWQREGYGGAFVGPEGPFDSVAVATYAQSVSEGRYLAQLYRMIDLAKSSGRGAEVARQIEADIQSDVIGLPQPGKSPLIPLVTSRTVLGGVDAQNADPQNHMAPEVYAAAKVRVFELMLRLQKAMGEVKPGVLYDGIPLMQDGKSNCVIVAGGHHRAAQELAGRIEQLGGVRPAIVAWMPAEGAGQVAVVLGTLADEAVKQLVAKQLESEITPHYPLAGRYAICRVAATAKRGAVILVAGGDAAGVEIGAHNLAKLLNPQNRW